MIKMYISIQVLGSASTILAYGKQLGTRFGLDIF